MGLSTKRTHEVCTADPHDVTRDGLRCIAYADGHLAVETWTHWEGARTGERWVTAAHFCPTARLPHEDRLERLTAVMLTHALQVARALLTDGEPSGDWRRTNRGRIVGSGL